MKVTLSDIAYDNLSLLIMLRDSAHLQSPQATHTLLRMGWSWSGIWSLSLFLIVNGQQPGQDC